MRRAAVVLIAATVIAAGTAGLLWLTTASAARFETDGDRLVVSGRLTLASTERLDRILEENGDLSTLVIGDVETGGDVTSLLQKGALVRRAGLATLVAPGVTLEGDGVYLFLSGIDRQLGEGAALAVADWQTPDGPASALPPDHPAHAERLDYVTRMLGSGEVYRAMLEAGRNGTGAMPADELLSLGILTSR
jgi:hypothetical protein